jgi:3-hydroxy-9,10-secoandrosta-1,3,5(10)-triene-9,17-dione monooxygenase reductase component
MQRFDMPMHHRARSPGRPMTPRDGSRPGTERARDSVHFRGVLGHLPTGVVVVTAVDDTPTGMTIGSFTSVSLDPPLVCFLPAKASRTWQRMRAVHHFCVNVLSREQVDVCRAFAQPGDDKFRGIAWRPARSGAPILDGVVAWIDCEMDVVHDAGDHDIVVGRVLDLDVAQAAPPLVFHRGDFGSVQAHDAA